MVFLADTALAVVLMALVAGAALLAYSCKEGTTCKGFLKLVAYVTLVVSFLALLCTSYYSLRYWEDGYFHHPSMMGGKHRSPGRRGPKGEKYRRMRHGDERGMDMMRRGPAEGRPSDTGAPETP